VRAGLIDAESRERVVDAYRFLLGLRLRLQLGALAAGGHATNRVALAELSAVERSRLKEAFRAIKAFQERGVFHYRTEF
jgi:CBS domain-containing protein